MEFKKKKKGQAAIEFLMTYGWMLLVVLIVGALIFSFVDFSSLLPNRLELTNMLRGDPAGSVVLAQTKTMELVVTNIGGRRILLNATAAYVKTDLNTYCVGVSARNVDTGNSDPQALTLLNGQTAVVTFNCSDGGTYGNPPTLYKGDVIQGSVTFQVKDPKTGIIVPVEGILRLKIS